MKPYLKRAKGSWQQGKGCKDVSTRAERQYSKREIQEQLDHDEEAYLERYHKGARTKNVKARLEYRIRWYEQTIEQRERWGDKYYCHYLVSGLRETHAELKKFLDKEDKS